MKWLSLSQVRNTTCRLQKSQCCLLGGGCLLRAFFSGSPNHSKGQQRLQTNLFCNTQSTLCLTHKTLCLRSTQILMGISLQSREGRRSSVEQQIHHPCTMHMWQNTPGSAGGTNTWAPIVLQPEGSLIAVWLCFDSGNKHWGGSSTCANLRSVMTTALFWPWVPNIWMHLWQDLEITSLSARMIWHIPLTWLFIALRAYLQNSSVHEIRKENLNKL